MRNIYLMNFIVIITVISEFDHQWIVHSDNWLDIRKVAVRGQMFVIN